MSIRSKHNEATALVQQLTLEEKSRLCSGKNFWHLEACERLDLPSVMVTDGPHGLRKQNQNADHVGLNKSVPATCFPPACALASTWDEELLHRIGQALGRESAAEDVTVLLGPGMNIKRHPLCGRNFEYFSEDPLLTGQLATAMINGIQSQGVGTSVKHYAVNNQEQGRMYIDAIIDERTMREIYLRGFEIAVRAAQPWTVMCAYNRVNGVYCSEHDQLLNKILRDEWGFEGLVVTDWGATNERVAGIVGGVDLEMPGSGGINDAKVCAAIANGELSEAQLDTAIIRNVSLSLLGRDLHGTSTTANYEAHHALAEEAAIASTVLLKNDSVLPIAADARIAIIGQFAKHPRYQGTGSSQVNPTQLDNALDAISVLCPNYVYSDGYDAKLAEADQQKIDRAVEAAATADVAIVFAGLPSIYESEGFDRPHMNLPDQHNALIEAVGRVNQNTIVVLANGAPVTMPWIDSVQAVIETYLPGQAGGGAIAKVLFGLANPAGKLAETFPINQQDILADTYFPTAAASARQVHYREGLHVGYRYFDSANKAVLFPFGHGLSYTQFTYSNFQLDSTHLIAGSDVEVAVTITNTGAMAGSEVVQLYVRPLTSTVYRPQQELKGFTKVHLKPGEQKTVSFSLNHAFEHWNQTLDRWAVSSGEYELCIGASSRDIRLRQTLSVQSEDSVVPDGHMLAETSEDEAFVAMLTHPIPAPEAVRPFHMNSSLAEIGETWLGARFKAKVVNGFLKTMGGGSSDATLNKMFEEMANNMPVRALSLFSRGEITSQQLDLTLAVLNHRYLKAFRLWWKLRSS